MYDMVDNLFNHNICGQEKKLDAYLLEPVHLVELPLVYKELFRKKFNLKITWAEEGDRLLVSGNMYSSINYARKKKTNNYTCQYNSTKFGQIVHFYKIEQVMYALINKYETKENIWPLCDSLAGDLINRTNVLDRFYTSVDLTKRSSLDLIHCDNLNSKCLELYFNHELYLTNLAYEFEHD
jgi:hypothetical protein